MISDLLKKPFPKEAIHFRAGATNQKKIQRETGDRNAKPTKAIALAYIDARDVMDRLDAVVGADNWEDKYFETASGRVMCELSIRYPTGWRTKTDGAGDTGTEGEKGAISDAFKRAAVKHGIGRYLYSFTNQWYSYDGWKFVNEEGSAMAKHQFKFPENATAKAWELSLSRRVNKETMQLVLSSLVNALEGEIDSSAIQETIEELSEPEQSYVWRLLSTRQREAIDQVLKESK